MNRWEYKKVSLNDLPQHTDDVDLLCEVGQEGWEVIAILPNNIAYLKRPLEPEPKTIVDLRREAHWRGVRGNDDGSKPEIARVVKVKYRDPLTNDTWSGRGRMAVWLKRKQEAGEDIKEYL